MSLDNALTALEQDNPVGALDALLDAWRTCRAAEIAAVIDTLSDWLDGALEGLESVEGHQDVAIARRAIDVPRLVDGLDEARVPDQVARAKILVLFPPDPRMAVGIVDTLGCHASTERKPALTRVMQILETVNDGRTIPLVEAILPEAHAGWTQPRIQKLLAKLTPAPPVPDASVATLAKVRDAVAACVARDVPSEEDLMSRAAGDPETAERRRLIEAYLDAPGPDALQVLADFLTERADPRGEFIALQQLDKPNGKQKKRMKALEKAHGLAWMQPLDCVLQPKSLRFENGFLDAGVAVFETDGQRRALVGHPLWSTVRELECNEDAVLTHPVMRSLRRADPTPEGLSELARAKRDVPLEAVIGTTYSDYGLWIRNGIDGDDPSRWTDALKVGALTNLRAMELWVSAPGRYWVDGGYETRTGSPTAADLAWLWDSPLGRQLEVLDIKTGGHRIGTWVDVLAGHPSLQRIAHRFVNGNTASGTGQVLAILSLTRDGLTLQMNSGDLQYLTMKRQLRQGLEGFDTAAFPAIDVQYIGSKKLAEGAFESVGALLSDVGFTTVTLPTGKSAKLEV